MSEPLTFRRVQCAGDPNSKTLTKGEGTLTFDAEGVAYEKASTHSVYRWPWESTKVSLLDPGRRRVNPEMMLLVGAFSLLGRKKFTAVVVSTAEGDVDFALSQDPSRRTLLLDRILSVAPAAISRVVAP